MANTPDTTGDPRLSKDVVADMENEEGPPLGGQTGQDRTVIPEHSKGLHQGRKTVQANRDRVARRL